MERSATALKQFLELCKEATQNDTVVLKLIQHRYNKTNPHFIWSKNFLTLIDDCSTKIIKDTKNRYVYIKDFIDELKNYTSKPLKHLRNTNKADTGLPSSSSSKPDSSISTSSTSLNTKSSDNKHGSRNISKKRTNKELDGSNSSKRARLDIESRSSASGSRLEENSAEETLNISDSSLDCTKSNDYRCIGRVVVIETAEVGIGTFIDEASISNNVPDSGRPKSDTIPGNSDSNCVSESSVCDSEKASLCIKSNRVKEETTSCLEGTMSLNDPKKKLELAAQLNLCDKNSSQVERVFKSSTVSDTKPCVLGEDSCASSSKAGLSSDKSTLYTTTTGEYSNHSKLKRLSISLRRINTVQLSKIDTETEISNSDTDRTKLIQSESVNTEVDAAKASTSGGPAPCEDKTVLSEKDERLQQRIQRLENLLEKISVKIKKLEESEISLDDMDKEDSTYLLEERYKQKFVKVWNKLCQLQQCSTDTGRETQQKFKYEGTKHTPLNKILSHFVNKYGLFPDYSDVRKMIIKCNKKHHLKIRKNEIDSLARSTFADIGNLLQKRRMTDYLQNFGCHLTDSVDLRSDPAYTDESLQSTLDSNRKMGKQKLEKVFDKYSELQDARKDYSTSEDEDDDDDYKQKNINYNPEPDDDADIETDDELLKFTGVQTAKSSSSLCAMPSTSNDKSISSEPTDETCESNCETDLIKSESNVSVEQSEQGSLELSNLSKNVVVDKSESSSSVVLGHVRTSQASHSDLSDENVQSCALAKSSDGKTISDNVELAKNENKQSDSAASTKITEVPASRLVDALNSYFRGSGNNLKDACDKVKSNIKADDDCIMIDDDDDNDDGDAKISKDPEGKENEDMEQIAGSHVESSVSVCASEKTVPDVTINSDKPRMSDNNKSKSSFNDDDDCIALDDDDDDDPMEGCSKDASFIDSNMMNDARKNDKIIEDCGASNNDDDIDSDDVCIALDDESVEGSSSASDNPNENWIDAVTERCNSGSSVECVDKDETADNVARSARDGVVGIINSYDKETKPASAHRVGSTASDDLVLVSVESSAASGSVQRSASHGNLVSQGVECSEKFQPALSNSSVSCDKSHSMSGFPTDSARSVNQESVSDPACGSGSTVTNDLNKFHTMEIVNAITNGLKDNSLNYEVLTDLLTKSNEEYYSKENKQKESQKSSVAQRSGGLLSEEDEEIIILDKDDAKESPSCDIVSDNSSGLNVNQNDSEDVELVDCSGVEFSHSVREGFSCNAVESKTDKRRRKAEAAGSAARGRNMPDICQTNNSHFTGDDDFDDDDVCVIESTNSQPPVIPAKSSATTAWTYQPPRASHSDVSLTSSPKKTKNDSRLTNKNTTTFLRASNHSDASYLPASSSFPSGLMVAPRASKLRDEFKMSASRNERVGLNSSHFERMRASTAGPINVKKQDRNESDSSKTVRVIGQVIDLS